MTLYYAGLSRRVVRTGHYHLAERRTYRASSDLISARYLVRCGVVVLVVRNEIARSVVKLKISVRNCSFILSVIGKSLKIENVK